MTGEFLEGLTRLGAEQRGRHLGRRCAPRLPGRRLGEEPGVVDRESRVGCQGAGQLLVVIGEASGCRVRQIEVAVHRVPYSDRHPEKSGHRRMRGREPDRTRVRGDRVDADGARVVDQGAEQSVTLREMPDARHLLGRHADMDELLEAAPFGDDAQRPVPCADELHRRLHDRAEHDRQIEV